MKQETVKTTDTGKKVYLTVDSNGALSVVVPKDQADQVEKDKMLKETGVVLPDEKEVQIGHLFAGALSRLDGNGEQSQAAFESFTNRFRSPR